ncbi:uracil-DNA glycosylase [Cysteiniphilum halobium]|uniref:uracil-DNA glycosylase n=1 Tax=Cysteiniphilum halobium TaxID=2219059 RepID=UPI000E653EAF|nr:uracil-DNA glycosylase [Cysteiniphilum halobium]
MQVNLSWSDVLGDYKASAKFKETLAFVKDEYRHGKQIFPQKEDIFNAFKLCPFESLKVVILGQDPYHNINQAHGLAFSVQEGIKPPPSLINIYKELHSDLNIKIPQSGNLSTWARQGVFLLNTVLTVQAHQAHSHANKGWECFTDHVISQINQYKRHVVFLLWGTPAQKKSQLIDHNKHLILKAPHPSPLSAHRGFFGSKHFSQTNNYLLQHNLTPIDWKV